MKKFFPSAVLIFILTVFLHSKVSAQNLVDNPSFENVSVNCAGFTGAGYINLVNWYNPDPTDSCSTPDWFSTCLSSFFPTHAPNSWLGNQAARTGNAYAGFIGYDASSGGYREYVEGHLSTPLVANQQYCVTFYISLADGVPFAINRIGMYLANSLVQFPVSHCQSTVPLPYTPQLQAPLVTYSDKTNWVQLQFNYTATGGERYFVIGNFFNNANTTVTNVGGGTGVNPFAYYFVDDVSIAPGPCSTLAATAAAAIGSCGQCNGTATATPTNGQSPYTYLWSNGQQTQTATALCAGGYTVTVTDAASAAVIASVTVGATTGITLAATPTATTCGANNGSATANASTGTGPFTYTWSNTITGATISNVASGTYNVTATGGGCSATASASIGASSSLTASTSTTNSTGCGTPNGSATVTPVGTGPFTYTWNNSLGTGASITGLSAGNYSVTVNGAGGCSVVASAVVASTGSGITLNTTSTNSGCSGNGSATAIVTAGSGPYTYAWTGSNSTSQTASNLAPGNYSVTVTGAGSCSASATVTVGSSGGGLTLSTSSTAAGCTATGSASVAVTAGTGPYTYTWNNNLGSGASISNVGAGTYTVTVTGAGSCSATASVSVTSSGGVSITTSSTATSCGNNNGSAQVSIATGTGPYTYAWNNSGNGTTDQITGLAAGSYTVTVTAGACSATATAVVAASNGITLTASAVSTSCGNNNGSVTAAPSSGSAPYTYTWNVAGGTATLANLPAGTYSVTVVDNNGCSATASTIVNPSGGTTVAVTSDKNIMCPGDSAQVCAPAGYASYAWNNNKTGPCIYTRNAGNYYVTVTDNGGCTATSNHLAISVLPSPPVSISINGDTLVAYNSPTYQWYLDGNPIAGANSHIYIATLSGNYTVAISDTNGCSATSNPTTISVKTGINDLAADANIKVYPNPLDAGNWHLQVTDAWLNSKVEIFDDNGRLVYRTEIKNTATEIEMNVAQGIYLMRIYSGQKSYAQKLLKL